MIHGETFNTKDINHSEDLKELDLGDENEMKRVNTFYLPEVISLGEKRTLSS